jgi:Uma2 family endonuclease
VATDNTHLRVSSGSYFIPDLCVLPRQFVRRKQREAPGRLEVYDEPMPLVVEVWSPPTGDYDIDEKLREYQQRGDLEIWRLHPYERTLTAWRRQPDGTSYEQTVYRASGVQPSALPGVTIDLDRLLD